MSWFFGDTARPGDWVVTTEFIKVTLTDHLVGDRGGIRPDTRGVITDSAGFFDTSLQARLDTRFGGPVSVRVRPGQVRVTRRAGGVTAFEQHSDRRGAIRSGAAVALLAPLVYFIASYLLHGGTKDGLLLALLNGAIYGVLGLIEYVLVNPASGVIYLALIWLAGRLAFGR